MNIPTTLLKFNTIYGLVELTFFEEVAEYILSKHFNSGFKQRLQTAQRSPIKLNCKTSPGMTNLGNPFIVYGDYIEYGTGS